MSAISEKTQAYLCWLKERGDINFFFRKKSPEIEIQKIATQKIEPLKKTPLVLIVGDGPSTQIESAEDLLPIKERQLLLNLLNSIGLRREEFHVINISDSFNEDKNQRQKQEMLFLNQISSLDPKVIVSLGQKVGTILLSDSSFNIRDHHGNFRNIYFGNKTISVLPIFHPRTLIAAPALKKVVWQDVQVLIDFLKKYKL